MKALWLADVLRDAGLNVTETEGWEKRGVGEFTAIKGVICHHTGAGATGALIDMIKEGRKGKLPLPGPLSQLFLDREGTFYVIASGRSNHAGKGNWQGITSGNSNMIGIEAQNNGDGGDPWPLDQMKAYIRGVAAILKKIKADAVMACGHKEYALPKGRKVDPTFDMGTFRFSVEQVMKDDKADVIHLQTTAPIRDMLQKGDMGPSVKELQKALKIEADGNFGPKTDAAVRAIQKKSKLVVDGKVGPKTWAALGVK